MPKGKNGIDYSQLTEFEKVEIRSFQAKNAVYYTGAPLSEKKVAPVNWKPGEPPFQDENGFYQTVASDHIAYRYELIKQIGEGSFARVFRAKDWVTEQLVALKIIKFGEESVEPLLEREIRVLSYLRRGDPDDEHNIVQLLDNFIFRGHRIMVFEMLSANLYNMLRHHDFNGIPMPFVKKISCHMLKAMEYMHLMDIIHGDLKPENIVLCNMKRSRTKIIDFGWAWMHGKDEPLSYYFQSRFYRAPEVILHGPLTPAVDMWSYGCIVAELASGLPIFAGEDKHDQLVLMTEVLGLPPQKVMSWRKAPKYFSRNLAPFHCRSLSRGVRITTRNTGDASGTIITGSLSRNRNIRGVPGSKHLRVALRDDGEKEYDEAFIDFLIRCLEWDPVKRMTPTEAIRHKWLSAVFPTI